MSRAITVTVGEALFVAACALFAAGFLGASIGRVTAPEALTIRDLEQFACSGPDVQTPVRGAYTIIDATRRLP